MNTTESIWGGAFGNEYHKRNRVDWRRRVPFWKDILGATGARSCFEFGCGPGWNLSAIKMAAEWDVSVAGEEKNEWACGQARMAGLDVDYYSQAYDAIRQARSPNEGYELAFTAGVLVHMPSEVVRGIAGRVINWSCDYVLAVEYYDPGEREIEYRGQKGLCWARDYGRLYQDLGLKMVMTGNAGSGFDDCTFWLLKV